MSNAIRFLETLGSTPETMSGPQYAQAVAGLEVDAELRQALLTRDPAQINRLLGGRASMMLVLAPADDQPKDDDATEGEGEDEQELRSVAA